MPPLSERVMFTHNKQALWLALFIFSKKYLVAFLILY